MQPFINYQTLMAERAQLEEEIQRHKAKVAEGLIKVGELLDKHASVEKHLSKGIFCS
tara:strand:- start:730 stop:900 length:171 start_codon:yes stop_codon:yes gene_type:complete